VRVVDGGEEESVVVRVFVVGGVRAHAKAPTALTIARDAQSESHWRAEVITAGEERPRPDEQRAIWLARQVTITQH